MTSGPIQSSYGEDPSQFGELYAPEGARHHATIVIIHGGFWRSRYDLSLGRPLAADLVAAGYTVWNIEYRRVGNGGGWPMTFEDVAAAIDHLATMDVDTAHVVAIGHSAGGHLAAWAAGRASLPAGAPGAAPRVNVTAVVSQAGVLNLAAAARGRIGSGAVADLLGTHVDFQLVDPIAHVPLRVPVLCVHSRADAQVPFDQSSGYVAAATAAGGTASLIETTGDHFTLIDPRSPDWHVVRNALPGLLG